MNLLPRRESPGRRWSPNGLRLRVARFRVKEVTLDFSSPGNSHEWASSSSILRLEPAFDFMWPVSLLGPMRTRVVILSRLPRSWAEFPRAECDFAAL